MPGCTDTHSLPVVPGCVANCRTVTQRAYGEFLCFCRVLCGACFDDRHDLAYGCAAKRTARFAAGHLGRVLCMCGVGCCFWLLPRHASRVAQTWGSVRAPCSCGRAGQAERSPRAAAAAASGRWLPRHAGVSGRPERSSYLACWHVRPGSARRLEPHMVHVVGGTCLGVGDPSSD